MKGALGVLVILIQDYPATVRKVAEKMECSERSVQRYIQELNDSGFSVKYQNNYVVLEKMNILNIFDPGDIDTIKVSLMKTHELGDKRINDILMKLDKLERMLMDENLKN